MEEYDISEDENEILTAPVVPRLFSMRENFDYPLCSNAIDDLFRNVNMRIKPNNQFKVKPMPKSMRLVVSNLKPQLQEIEDNLMQNVDEWKMYLQAGLNLFFYGIGSKQRLLQRFKGELTSYNVMNVNALNFKFTFRRFITELKRALDVPDGLSFVEFYQLLSAKNRLNQKLCIVLSGFESRFIREQLDYFTFIFEHPDIQLVTSIEKHKSLYKLGLQNQKELNFVWIKADTHQHYIDEVTQTRSTLWISGNFHQQEIAGQKAILRSLTTTQQRILQVLQNIQGQKGVPWRQFFQACQQEMLLYTEKQLRDYLVEARDHKLVEDKKGPNGEQLVFLMTHID